MIPGEIIPAQGQPLPGNLNLATTIVDVTNTVGSVLPGTDGLGDWNIPWEQWKAGNADV